MSPFITRIKKLWPSKIRTHLILGIALVHLVLMAFFVADQVSKQRNFLKKLNEEQTNSFTSTYALNATRYILADDFEGLERLTFSQTKYPNLRYAMIVSPEGLVLAHSQTKFVGTRLSDSVSLQITRSDSSVTLFENDDILDIAVPVISNQKPIGWARVGIGQAYIYNNLAAIVRNGILYILLALGIGFIFALLISSGLTKGLYQLISVTEKIRAGDRNQRAAPFRSYELSRLSSAFNQMLDQISANEKLLNNVIENMPVGVWLLNEKGEIVSANTAGREIWSDARYVGIDEMNIYKGWFSGNSQPIEPHQWAAIRAVKNGETVINEEVQIEAFDRTRKTILNSAIPLKDTNNKIIGAIAINVDITAQKKMTEQLALSESTLRGAFEYSGIGMAMVTQDGRFINVNRELCAMLGYTKEELLAKHFPEINQAETRWEDTSFSDRANGGKDSLKVEKQFLHKNGTAIWVCLTSSTVRDSQGNPLFYITQIEDITQRKNAEQALREREAMLLHEKNLSDTIINGMPGIFYLADMNGRLLRWNTNLETITGYSNRDISGMKTTDFVKRQDLDKILSRRKEALSNGKASAEIEIATKRQQTLTYYITVIPIRYNEQQAILGIGIDFTEKKQNELTLVQKNWEIQERVKELRCLYKLSELANNKSLSLDQILEESVTIIPLAYQYHDFTCAGIFVGGKTFSSVGFTETEWKQEEPIYVKGQVTGKVMVCYKVNKHTATENLFLLEEQELIRSMASILGNAIETRMAEVELRNMAEEFRAIIENTNESILLLSPELKVIRYNKTAKDRLLENLGKELQTGADFRDFLYPGTEARFYQIFNDALSGRTSDVETEQTDIKGNPFWIRTKTYPVYVTGKQLMGVTLLTENITARKKAEQMIVHFSRLYQFTSAINDMMLRAESKQAIFAEACQIAISQGKFLMAWIGNFSAETKKLEFNACSGYSDGYLENLQQNLTADLFEQSRSGKAIRNKTSYYCNDIANDPTLLPWREEALKRGYRSLVSLPVLVGSRLEAIFTLYMPEAFFFNDEEIKLLQEVTNNIAYAIEKLELKDRQKIAEQELKESEEKFRKLVEETLVGVFILQGGNFIYVNPQFESMSGYAKKELLHHMTFTQVFSPHDMDPDFENFMAGKTGEKPSDYFVLQAVRKDRVKRQFETILSTITFSGKPAIIGTVIDITEKVEEEKRINKAVTDAQEQERQQISMELHDNVKQIMAASMLNIDFIKMQLHAGKTTMPSFDSVQKYIREAIEELRRISHQLAPSIDDTLPLEDKIITVVDTMNISKNIAVSYEFGEFEKPLRGDVQLALYRILQEQFSNILQYAKASRVEICVQERNGNLYMTISDNGVGFDPVIRKAGIGLENIKRRTQVFNGEVMISSAPGKGCKLDICIPLN